MGRNKSLPVLLDISGRKVFEGVLVQTMSRTSRPEVLFPASGGGGKRSVVRMVVVTR